MSIARDVSCVFSVLAALPACSLLIDTNPDGLREEASTGIEDGSHAGTGNAAIAGGASSRISGQASDGSVNSTGGGTREQTGIGGLAGDGGPVSLTSTDAGHAIGTNGGGSSGTNSSESAAGERTVGANTVGATTPAATCSDEGCACSGSATVTCNDCGIRYCESLTKRWSTCSAPQDPAKTQCVSSSNIQTCGLDGKWASATCSAADLANCSAACVTGPTGGACVVAARDGDKDGHTSKACAVAPGDDCDDDNANVYLGAPEICDGVDNDCDGNVDLKDGLSLSGTAAMQAYHSQIDLAWSPNEKRFAMLATGVNFGTLNPTTGATSWNSTTVTELFNEYHIHPQLVWNPSRDTFVITFVSSGRAGVDQVWVFDMTTQGVSSNQYFFTGTGTPSLAVREAGDMLLAYSDGSAAYIARHSVSNLIDVEDVQSKAVGLRVAAAGDQSAIVFGEDPPGAVTLVRLNAAIIAGTPVQLSSAGHHPDITAVTNGYGITWANASGFDYQVVNSSTGATVCGPTHVAFGDGELNSGDGVAIAASQYGTLVLASDVNAKRLELVRFDSACRIVDEAPVHDAATAPSSPAIAVGGGFVAMSWSEASDGYVRIVGERLCN